MKIALVFEIFYPAVNGIVTSSVNLSENLIEEGHEVVFIAPAWSEEQQPFINGKIPVHYIASRNNWAYPGMRNVLPWNRRVEVLLRRERIDVLHITGPWLLTWACMRAARKLGVPVVHTFHTMLHEPSYVLYMVRTRYLVPVMQAIAWRYYSLYMRRSVITTSPSRMARDELRRRFPNSDIRRISNGVDLDRFKAYDSREQLIQKHPEYRSKVFIYVGRLGQEKSIGELIEAMSLVVPHEPEARLIIIGDGPSAGDCRSRVRELGLSREVRFLGRLAHDELIRTGLIHHAHAFVTASTTENQPMTVIEAICCGVPAVVPDVDGMNELVTENGLRFVPHSPDSIAAALRRLIGDTSLHERCAAATLRRGAEFDGRSVARRFLEVYREATARGG